MLRLLYVSIMKGENLFIPQEHCTTKQELCQNFVSKMMTSSAKGVWVCRKRAIGRQGGRVVLGN
jgi:hypothetical protein